MFRFFKRRRARSEARKLLDEFMPEMEKRLIMAVTDNPDTIYNPDKYTIIEQGLNEEVAKLWEKATVDKTRTVTLAQIAARAAVMWGHDVKIKVKNNKLVIGPNETS